MTDDWDLPLVTSLQHTLFLSSQPLQLSLSLFLSPLTFCPFLQPFHPSSISFTHTLLSSHSLDHSLRPPHPLLLSCPLPLHVSFRLPLCLSPSVSTSFIPSFPFSLPLSYYKLISWKCSFPQELITDECRHQEQRQLIKESAAFRVFGNSQDTPSTHSICV